MPPPSTVMQHAMHNRRDINGSLEVGCVHCLRRYKPEEIKEWTDQTKQVPEGDTAVCPHCKVDAVLPGCVVPYMDEGYLSKAHDYWFKKPSQPLPGQRRSVRSGLGRA